MDTKVDKIPTTARALLQPDPASTKLILTSLPVPKPKPNSNEHLIRVHALALCNGELLWPKNFPPADPSARTLVPGYDVAGTILEAPKSSPFRVGDEVYARTMYAHTGYARDYTIGVTEELAHRPKRLSWAESAATALSAQSAWQALFVQAGFEDINSGLAKGKRILVTGASGSVGLWVVQFAPIAGAEVVGTCGSHNSKLVESLGAKEVIGYRSLSLQEWARDSANLVDIVIDCSGRKVLEDAWWTVKHGGILISIVQPTESARPAGCSEKNVKNWFFIMQPDRAQLEQITRLIDDGKCHSLVDSVWRFEDYEKAYERADSGRAVGKVVLDLMAKDL